MELADSTRYRAITHRSFERTPQWASLMPDVQEAVQVVSQVLPFRTNTYILEHLIDWDQVPSDPMFQLTIPQRDMLEPLDYHRVRGLLHRQAPRQDLDRAVRDIRMRMNPQPAGQLTHNVPELNGRRLTGLQHKYRQTVLFFPSQGQTCHAYCTYCFRWAQFVDLPEMKFQARESSELSAYLRAQPRVSDVLVTGGDPLIMKTHNLTRYLEPLLAPELEHVQHIRIGTKSMAYWPQRFVTDDDADELLRLFETIVASGRHLAIMGHYSHPLELDTSIARQAIRRIRDTGAEIRMQAPIIRHVNDQPDVWADMWKTGVGQGLIPYYMFVERDTGPKSYFEVPLARAYRVFREAYSRVSGLARTVRGPSMSALPGKVHVLGTSMIHGERVFVLEFLQARDPAWVRQPFYARYDTAACWIDELVPAFGERRFFFEEEAEVAPAQASGTHLPLAAS